MLSLNSCLLSSFTSFFYSYCHTELLTAGNMLVVTTVKPVTSDSQWGTKKVLFLVRMLLFSRGLMLGILPNLEWQNLSAAKAWIIHKIWEVEISNRLFLKCLFWDILGSMKMKKFHAFFLEPVTNEGKIWLVLTQ